MATIDEIKLLLQPIQKDMRETKDKTENIQELLIKYNQDFKEMEERYQEMEVKLEQKDIQIENFERKLRENNLVIYGIEEKPSEKPDEIILQLIQETLQVPSQMNDIEDAWRIGRKYPSNGCRLMMVELASKKLKQQIFQNLRFLKNTNLKIEEDYSKKTVEERKTQTAFNKR